MKTHIFHLILFYLILLFSIAETNAQLAITLQGYGDVKWGTEIHIAASALPDFFKADHTANKNLNYGIPCDTVLAKDVDTGQLALIFFDGKFIAIRRDVALPAPPDGVSTKDLKASLVQLLRDALGPTNLSEVAAENEIDIRIDSISNSRELQFTVLIVNKSLDAVATTKRDAILNSNKSKFLDSIAEKILKP